MSGLITLLVETAKTMGAEAAISAVVAKFKDGSTRRKVLDALPAQLEQLGIRGGQAQYVMGELSHPDALRRVGRLTTVADLQAEVRYSLKLPERFAVGDPRQLEGELVTAALYLALLEVECPGQYQSLVDQPKVKERILEYLPTIGQAVQETQRRREAPVEMAAGDISQVLARAGQHEAKIVTGADGKPELSGPLNLQFSAQGENAKRLQEWFQETEGRLVLDVSDGSLQVSLGDQELDKLFFPGEASHFAFERADIELNAKLKIIGKTRTKFANGTFQVKPASKESHLTFGHEKCHLHFIFRSEPGEPTTVNLHFSPGDRPLSLEDMGLLDTLALILQEGTRIQVLNWVNQYTQEKQEIETEAIIFTMDQQLEDVGRFRWGIHVHLLLLKVVVLISEAGFDPEELFLPAVPFDKAVGALQQILAVHDASGIGEKAQVEVVTTRLGYEQLQQATIPLLRVGNEIGFGPVVVVCHRQITDFRIVRAVETPESDSVNVIIEGQWGEGQLHFLTPEQYQIESGEEAGDPG